MHESLLLLFVIVFLALVFEFVNGFHDAANAIATSVSTKVLTPKAAVILAAVLNVAGALSGTAVAKTVGSGIVDHMAVNQITIISCLLSAIIWDVITWYYGLPTSSSHAIMASIVGAGIGTAGLDVVIMGGAKKVVYGLVFSPLLGFGIGLLVMFVLMWIFAKKAPSSVTGIFGKLQIVSASYMAFSHGSNDGQKTMGIITMAVVGYYGLQDFNVPLWVIISCAVAIGCGTYAGGWRIIKTMGVKLVHLKPIHGFAAEATAGTIIEVCSRIGLPISTTHTISSAIMGVGASKRFSAVRWGIGWTIIAAWVITLPVCIGLSFGICKLLQMILL